jgi:hypothetical protein
VCTLCWQCGLLLTCTVLSLPLALALSTEMIPLTHPLRLACILLGSVALAAADQISRCLAPDSAKAKCECNGNMYDFSQIQPSDGTSYFSGPDPTNDYMYYFQMTGGGLPSDMPYCTFNSTGNAAVIAGDKCFPLGLVAQQSWEIDTTQNPQVIQVTFSGGHEGRQTVASVTCDPSADDPTFIVKGETRTGVYEVDITSKFACAVGPPSPPSPAPPPGPAPPPRPPAQGVCDLDHYNTCHKPLEQYGPECAKEADAAKVKACLGFFFGGNEVVEYCCPCIHVYAETYKLPTLNINCTSGPPPPQPVEKICGPTQPGKTVSCCIYESSLEPTTASECRAFCRKSPACAAWTWNKEWKRPQCFLHASPAKIDGEDDTLDAGECHLPVQVQIS